MINVIIGSYNENYGSQKAVGNMKLLEYNGIKTILRRYSIMSLVQAYITQNFILAGGDTRATLNGGVIIDNFKKNI